MFYFRRPECGPVGVADRTISDARMTASTHYTRPKQKSYYGSRSYTYYYPYYGRLNENRGGRAWCARTSYRTDYLQVDMGAVLSVCAVATQGEGGSSYWTTSYKVHLSSDGVTWNAYKENNVEKVNKLIYNNKK